jgi:ribonuclease HIII
MTLYIKGLAVPTSLALSKEELDKLKQRILQSNMKRVQPKSTYEALRVSDGAIQLIIYKSGKVVHNDSPDSRKLLDDVLSAEMAYDYLIGTDEVGKGEWYGPLVVACVALRPKQIVDIRGLGVRDSKELERSRLMKLAQELSRISFTRDLLTLMPEKYNQLYKEFSFEKKTLNDLLAWAHASVIRRVLAELGERRVKILIDKFDVEKTELRLLTTAHVSDRTPNVEIIQTASGDTEIPVSVASILAKNEFEGRVAELERKFGVRLRGAKPDTVSREILPYVAKTHFKNVAAVD